MSLSIVSRDHSYGWNPAARVPRVVGEEVVWVGSGGWGATRWSGLIPLIAVNKANAS